MQPRYAAQVPPAKFPCCQLEPAQDDICEEHDDPMQERQLEPANCASMNQQPEPVLVSMGPPPVSNAPVSDGSAVSNAPPVSDGNAVSIGTEVSPPASTVVLHSSSHGPSMHASTSSRHSVHAGVALLVHPFTQLVEAQGQAQFAKSAHAPPNCPDRQPEPRQAVIVDAHFDWTHDTHEGASFSASHLKLPPPPPALVPQVMVPPLALSSAPDGVIVSVLNAA